MTAMNAAPPPELSTGRQGNYAGAVTRLVAFATDIAAAWLLYSLGAGALSLVVQLITGKTLDLSKHAVLAVVVLVVWEFVYFAGQWALGGRTIGMALFGIRVVMANGSQVTVRAAVTRTLALPLSIICLGLGFLGILTHRERRAWHDRIAGTAVVYDWDARAARLRWLAKRQTPMAGAAPTS